MALSSKLEAIEKGKYTHIGAAPYPKATPGKGDRWIEFDASDNYVETWVWNGTYWLSLDVFSYELNTSSNNFSATALVSDYPVDPATNIFVTALIVNVLLNTISSAANQWTWTLNRNNSTNTPTAIGSVNTVGIAGNTWTVLKAALNTHVNVAATTTRTLRITESRVGTLTKVGTAKIEYRKARI